MAIVLTAACMALPSLWTGYFGTARATAIMGLAAVAMSAAFGGQGPGLLATALFVVAGKYFYIEPTGTFRFDKPGDLFVSCVSGSVGVVISLLFGALDRAGARIEAVLSSVADAYYFLDRHWRFTDLNDRAADAFGRSRDDLLGSMIWDVLPGFVGGEVEHQQRAAMETGRPVTCETRSPRDASKWIEMRAYPSRGGLAVFFADVTARRSNEEELRRQRDLTRAITDNAADSLFLLDAQGRVTYMNATAETTFGWRQDELLGKVLHDVVHRHESDAPGSGDPSFPVAECPMLRVFSSGRALKSHEDVFFRRDDSPLNIACSHAPILDESGNVSAAVLVAHDISQRVRIEQALRNSEARLAAIFNQAGVGIAQTDLEGRYLLVNRRYCELVGRSTRELLGMRSSDVTHPQDLPAHEQALTALPAEVLGGAEHVVEKRYVRPDGSVVWGQASVTVVRDAEGKAHSLLGVVQDISDRKRAEEALLDAKNAADVARETAEAANRAKDRFLAVLSHELRTPLTPVLTAVQMLERDPVLPPELLETMAMIRRNVELEARLIDDLLDLNRVSHGKLQLQLGQPDVHEKLRSVAQICDSDARAKGVRFTIRPAAPRRHVRGDSARLQQVFWNLIKNAIKFTPEGGDVEVSTACEPCGAGGPERLVVTVRDTGVGIDPQVMPRIFDAFVQGDGTINRTFGGMGLGLAITRALVELHCGTIAAASPGPGQGATFTVTLPLVADAPQDSASASPGGADAASRAAALSGNGELAGVRILLVEDDADSAKILAKLLRRTGAQVQTADSVATGLQSALADRHDLLISDIGLPDGSGLDLMRQLVAARRDAVRGQVGDPFPAIALSGFGMEEDIRRSREAGFAEHLTKPVNLDHLHEAIRRVLSDDRTSAALSAV